MYYQMITVNSKSIAIVWHDADGKPQIECIYLPGRRDDLLAQISKEFPVVKQRAQKLPAAVAGQIIKLYDGKEAKFDLSYLHLSRLAEFSAKVLRQTFKIPRGKVTTYSGLAAQIGSPGAARAVGTALANNPFPLVIPCHRVVRADGSWGGFGGGIKMKKELLAKEGVVFESSKRVSAAAICYKS